MNRRDALKAVAAAGVGFAGSTVIAEPNDGFVLKRTFEHNGKTWQHFSKIAFKKSDARDLKNRVVILNSRNLEPFVCDCTLRVEHQYMIIDGKKVLWPSVYPTGQTVEGYYIEQLQDLNVTNEFKQPVRTTLVLQ